MLWIDGEWYYDTSLEENECCALPFMICLAMYCGYRMFPSANELQPPSRFQTHPNLPQGKEQVTLILSKTVRCKLPLNIDNTLIIRHNSICPSPTGEVRWGLIWLRWRQMLWIVGSYSVYHHQPPHVLPRRGDASYSDWSVSYFRPVDIAAGWWTPFLTDLFILISDSSFLISFLPQSP